MPLTRKQTQILAFIEKISKEKGIPPTFREIQKHFGFSSLGTVYHYIQALKKKKVVEEGKYAPIALEKENSSCLVNVPIIGEVSEGHPPKIWEESSSYLIPKTLLINENCAYFFLSKGDSLQSEFIDDEDLILVQTGIQPEEGDLIFALKRGALLIRMYFKEENLIRLESKGKKVPPLFFEEHTLSIQGVITAVIRSLL